ncbi:hypothetical protein HNR07_006463 [Nocardiopsis metallicus]|uniref:Uncharacterized protein n=1 Tax=Nocardiopsis metallicus TaxID=179819 RepID=A0A840WUV2_9ACTN|nr:hypothetical protein [Nocardiopsis metallicus]
MHPRVSLCAPLVKIGLQQSAMTTCQAERTWACDIARYERDPPPAVTPVRTALTRLARWSPRVAAPVYYRISAAPRSMLEPRYPSSILTARRNRRRNPAVGPSVRPRIRPFRVFCRFSGAPGVAHILRGSPPRRPPPDRRRGWSRHPSALPQAREPASTSENPLPGPGRAPTPSAGPALPLAPLPQTLPYLTETLSSPTRRGAPSRRLIRHIRHPSGLCDHGDHCALWPLRPGRALQTHGPCRCARRGHSLRERVRCISRGNAGPAGIPGS